MSRKDLLPPVIKTKRLSLRAPAETDLPNMVELSNNWNVVEPTAVMPFPYREADGRAFLATVNDPDKPRAYAIVDQADSLIGVVSLKFEAGKSPELGYWVGEPFWGQGFAPEAAMGLLSAAQAIGIGEVRARVLAHNKGSIRVLEKSGFVVVEHTTSIVERHHGKPLLIMSWSAA
jgi:RimJ/RimL family protein N-acetyltransferase